MNSKYHDSNNVLLSPLYSLFFSNDSKESNDEICHVEILASVLTVEPFTLLFKRAEK